MKKFIASSHSMRGTYKLIRRYFLRERNPMRPEYRFDYAKARLNRFVDDEVERHANDDSQWEPPIIVPPSFKRH